MEREQQKVLERQRLAQSHELFPEGDRAINLAELMRRTDPLDGREAADWMVYSERRVGDITILKRYSPDGQVTTISDRTGELVERTYDLEIGERELGDGYLRKEEREEFYRIYTASIAMARTDAAGNQVLARGSQDLVSRFNAVYDSLHPPVAVPQPVAAPDTPDPILTQVGDVPNGSEDVVGVPVDFSGINLDEINPDNGVEDVVFPDNHFLPTPVVVQPAVASENLDVLERRVNQLVLEQDRLANQLEWQRARNDAQSQIINDLQSHQRITDELDESDEQADLWQEEFDALVGDVQEPEVDSTDSHDHLDDSAVEQVLAESEPDFEPLSEDDLLDAPPADDSEEWDAELALDAQREDSAVESEEDRNPAVVAAAMGAAAASRRTSEPDSAVASAGEDSSQRAEAATVVAVAARTENQAVAQSTHPVFPETALYTAVMPDNDSGSNGNGNGHGSNGSSNGSNTKREAHSESIWPDLAVGQITFDEVDSSFSGSIEPAYLPVLPEDPRSIMEAATGSVGRALSLDEVKIIYGKRDMHGRFVSPVDGLNKAMIAEEQGKTFSLTDRGREARLIQPTVFDYFDFPTELESLIDDVYAISIVQKYDEDLSLALPHIIEHIIKRAKTVKLKMPNSRMDELLAQITSKQRSISAKAA